MESYKIGDTLIIISLDGFETQPLLTGALCKIKSIAPEGALNVELITGIPHQNFTLDPNVDMYFCPDTDSGYGKWKLTDPDCFQHVRKINDSKFGLVEIDYVAGYGLCSGIVDVNDYTRDEIEEISNFYGYCSYEELCEEYGESSTQIIAECIFETYREDFVERGHTTMGNNQYNTEVDALVALAKIVDPERAALHNKLAPHCGKHDKSRKEQI